MGRGNRLVMGGILSGDYIPAFVLREGYELGDLFEDMGIP